MESTLKIPVLKYGISAVCINIFGVIFSGLVFPVLSMIYHPQPPWNGYETFINSFHLLQTATFFCGFFLIFGSLLTFIVLYLTSRAEKKFWSLAGLAVNIIFTAIVFINYVIQTTYVPYLATNNPPEAATVLAVFSMANPGSFAWALEMYGWGGIGLSFIFMSFIFTTGRFEKLLRALFLFNGISSCLSALMTSADMKWIFTSAGFSALVVWNLLVLVIDIILIRYFKFQLSENL